MVAACAEHPCWINIHSLTCQMKSILAHYKGCAILFLSLYVSGACSKLSGPDGLKSWSISMLLLVMWCTAAVVPTCCFDKSTCVKHSKLATCIALLKAQPVLVLGDQMTAACWWCFWRRAASSGTG